MCRVLSVKPSSYYDWLSRDISCQQVHRNQCELLVKAAHSETHERYGVERLHATLTEQGYDISLYMVRSIKEEHGIKCRRHKRFKVTTGSNHNELVYPNILNQQFDAKRPNKAWVSDITYIWTHEGWLYLAGDKDLYTFIIYLVSPVSIAVRRHTSYLNAFVHPMVVACSSLH